MRSNQPQRIYQVVLDGVVLVGAGAAVGLLWRGVEMGDWVVSVQTTANRPAPYASIAGAAVVGLALAASLGVMVWSSVSYNEYNNNNGNDGNKAARHFNITITQQIWLVAAMDGLTYIFWMMAWHWGPVWLAVGLGLVNLAAKVGLYRRLWCFRSVSDETTRERLPGVRLARAAVSLHLADGVSTLLRTVAVAANVAGNDPKSEGPGFGRAWGLTSNGSLVIVGLGLLWGAQDPVFGLGAAWVLVGVAVNLHEDHDRATFVAALVGAGLLVAAVTAWTAYTLQTRSQRTPLKRAPPKPPVSAKSGPKPTKGTAAAVGSADSSVLFEDEHSV